MVRVFEFGSFPLHVIPFFPPGMAQTTTLVAVAGVTLLASVAAYAAYFDYKRRTDAAFRKQLSQSPFKGPESAH